jgi:cell fate regulator YaaT (PSP1 superfamily)
MTIVVGVRFKDSGKTYQFDPRDVPVVVGDWVIVETVRGPELGRIALPHGDVPHNEILGDLKPVLRRAEQADFDRLAHFQQYIDEALAICAEKIAQHALPMALVKAEYTFDGSRLTFFFTAEKRVDFRELVRDLARTFHTRIELRQVGPRDEAKLLGGIGPCGRLLCCATFLPDFARVSITMAQDQDLPLNPIKISGVCGRLLCCLSYEHEQYRAIKAELPTHGAWVRTPEGPGTVIAVNVVRETVTVELTNGTTIDCTAGQIAAVTEQVATEARARTAEGLTPVARGVTEERSNRGRDEDVAVRVLEVPADRPTTSKPLTLEAALGRTIEREAAQPDRRQQSSHPAERGPAPGRSNPGTGGPGPQGGSTAGGTPDGLAPPPGPSRADGGEGPRIPEGQSDERTRHRWRRNRNGEGK